MLTMVTLIPLWGPCSRAQIFSGIVSNSNSYFSVWSA